MPIGAGFFPEDEVNPMTSPVRIAIVGGGIAGLTAAYDLTRINQNVTVTIYEHSDQLGGLAAGFKGRDSWEWPLEHFYHHIFTNDDAIIGLTREIGAADTLEIHTPVTSMYHQGALFPFDSPLRLLAFPHLPLTSKLRMGLVLAYLRYHPKPPWRSFDRQLADEWLAKRMGSTAYESLWQPMLEGKFGDNYTDVNLAWFWARVYKRTPKLGYYRGGFQALIDALAARVKAQGATILCNESVTALTPLPEGRVEVTTATETAGYDLVLSTVSPQFMQRLASALPDDYLGQLSKLRSMGAVVLTVALDRQLLEDGTYWVNVPKREGLPFLALVEHTNMIDPQHYDGDHLLYIGDYLEADHPHFDLSAQELLDKFLPYLDRFHPGFDPTWVTGTWVHKATYAQPVPPVGYETMIPELRTPLPGLYFASMSQVYPWDRGTNYAVEIGRKVAAMMQEDMLRKEHLYV